MNENETAGASTPAYESARPTPARVTREDPPEKSTALLLQIAVALPVGVGGFCILPSGEWYDLWRESAGVAHARRVTEDEVRDGLLAEARFLQAEPLGGVA